MLVSVPRSWPGGRPWRPSATNGRAGLVSQIAKDLHLAVGLASDTGIWLPVLSFVREQILPSLQAHGIGGNR